CALSLPAKICQIFMDPACTSNTEEDGHGKLLRTHLSWRSQEFTNFAHNLDVATIEQLCKEKGVQYVQRNKLLELRLLETITTSVKPPVPIKFCQEPCADSGPRFGVSFCLIILLSLPMHGFQHHLNHLFVVITLLIKGQSINSLAS
ncbi:uncharacterized protein VP01_11562g1, partial [Puccinia sorghi]